MPRVSSVSDLGVIAGALLCLTPSLRSQAQPASAKKPIVITHVSVVDVKAGRLLPNQTVTLLGERIVRIALAREAKTPPGATVIPGKGLFLMPGLFDSHVHLNNPEQETRMLVANGVTFVRDMGGGTAERIAERAQELRGEFFCL